MSLLDHVVAVVLAAVLGATSTAVAGPAPPAGDLVVGRDVSWPNCPKGLGIPSRPTQGKPMPPSSARFVVVGLDQRTGVPPEPVPGGAGRVRPPAAPLDRGVRRRDLPDPRAARGVRRPGIARAQRLRRTRDGAGRAERRRPCERSGSPRPSCGSTSSRSARRRPGPSGCRPTGRCSTARSRPTGTPGSRVGFYSTPSMWRDIVGTGPLRLPRVAHGRAVDAAGGPGVAAGRSSRAVEAVLAQWYSTREDFDLTLSRAGRPSDVLARVLHPAVTTRSGEPVSHAAMSSTASP